MANTLKDLSDGDITREALVEFHNALTFLKTINNQYDNRFGRDGHKNNGTLLIRNPNQYTVRTGKVMDVQEADENTTTLTVATQKGVDMESFSSLEQTMQIEDFRARYLRPAMLRLAADVESTIITSMYKEVFNIVGTAVDKQPAALIDIRRAGARLTEFLAPRTDRYALLTASAMSTTTDTLKTLFHANAEIEKSFLDGYVGHAAGFDWLETEMIPSHTNGSRTDTTPVVNTSTDITSGSSSIVITGFTNAKTLKEGDVFTIAGVYAVNLETKVRQSFLQQFVVTTDYTLNGNDTIVVSPTPYTSGARQNVEIVSAGSGKAVVNLTAGGSGAASTSSRQNLCYHRDAFTFVTADLPLEPGQRMSREVMDGISMRIWHGSDFKNDEFGTRIDVLFGAKAIRPEWAARVRTT